ncbi:MAG: TonB-dependent receptor plug domain-containing protein [Verrucomicrobiota bacterium]|nr:TonB-dependent receptor plug domain-containing protein [Verrucomicrobiota bacterium]
MPLRSRKIYPNFLDVFQGIAGATIWLFAASHSIGQLDSLDRLTLEELRDVPVVLSSKNPTQLFEAPVGSFVFDEAAIGSLPIDSIAEMLRYAPGVHIIRPSNGIWGVGMRGINSRFFNRVEFNVDEQNVYRKNRLRLIVNQDNANRQGIVLSSKLVELSVDKR